MIAKLMILLLIAVTEGKYACTFEDLHARIKEKDYKHYNYVNNENCVLSIRPVEGFRIGYYLVIKWTSFEVEGTLPSCKDYVEVLLTRKQKSIGKYCSGSCTSSVMFDMYSSDGYAAIRFKSDGTVTKGGFRFTYQLKSINSQYIGGYGNRSCVTNIESQYSGIFYGSGWPKAYTAEICYHAIILPPGKAVRIALMDLDLRDNNLDCNDDKNDYFCIKGSNDLLETLQSVLNKSNNETRKYCGTKEPQLFYPTYKYVYLVLNTPIGSYPHSPNRGFMMGYVIYDKNNSAMLITNTVSLSVLMIFVAGVIS